MSFYNIRCLNNEKEMELTEKQQRKLHIEIYLYLVGKKFTHSAQIFNKEADLSQKMINACVNVLSTKWKSVATLQEKMSDLSLKIRKLEEEVSYSRREEISSTKLSQARIPTQNLAVEIVGEQKLTGHHGAVLCGAFHPHLPHLATGSQDNSIKIWDVLVGQQIMEVAAHKDGVTCVNYDPEGKKLVSCSIDLCIKVWNAEKSYQCISTFYGHEHTVSYVSFILGDSYILSSSRDFKIKLWDSQNGSVKREFLGHTGWVRKLAITKDYIHFVSCSGDQIINVWMLEKEKPIFSFKISGDVIENVAIIEKQSSQKILHARYINKKIQSQEKNIKEKQSLREKKNSKTNFIIVTSGRDKLIRLFLKNGVSLYTFKGHQSWVRGLALDSDERFLFSSSDDESIIIWDLHNGIKMEQKKCHEHFILNIVVHHKYHFLASVSSDCSIKIWKFLQQSEK